MDRHPLAVSAATGSLSSSLLLILKDFVFPNNELPGHLDLSCPICPDQVPLNFYTGLFLGFLFWPTVEVLVLLKQWVTLCLRNKVAQFGWQGRLYKVL